MSQLDLFRRFVAGGQAAHAAVDQALLCPDCGHHRSNHDAAGRCLVILKTDYPVIPEAPLGEHQIAPVCSCGWKVRR